MTAIAIVAPASVQDARLKLLARGYIPLPLYGKMPPVYGKNNSRKGLTDWQKLTNVSREMVEMWSRTWPDAVNTGVLTATTPALDLDILNADAIRAIEEHVRERWEERGPVLIRIGKAPKAAILFSTDEPFSKIVRNVIAANGSEEKIEFLADGQQLVVDGIHPDTALPYRWHGGELWQTPREELPYIHAPEAQKLADEVVELLVRDFDYSLAPERPKHRQQQDGGQEGQGGEADWLWLLKNIREGRELHDSLCILAAKLITTGMTRDAAVKLLRAEMTVSTAPRDERWDDRFDDIPRLVDSAQAKYEGPKPQSSNRHFPLKPFKTITLSTTANYLVKGIIPRGGLCVIWGPPKCGKSFWTFDLMMHVALGWQYRGRRVTQGAVVYLALEGGHGFAARVEAWRRRHLVNHQGDVPFYLLDVPVDLIRDHDKLIKAIRAQLPTGQAPIAIVIDTLNRALMGDENKPDDMAKFIRAADTLRAAFECAVGIVHHCGVQGGRPRGHTSLSGADDVQIAVERDEAGIIITKVEYMKDGDASAPMASLLERVELGTDDDGDPITSCVIVEATSSGKSTVKLSPNAVAALRSLHECLADMGQPAPPSGHIPSGVTSVTLTAWREYLLKHNLINPEGSYREQFRRLHVTLKNAGKIGIWDGNVWAVT
jgi:AAA domain/Bifunctional DNA primase/polymerase, N-terminal